MGKVFKHGHAVPVPQDELLTPNNNPNRKEPLKHAKLEQKQAAGVEDKGCTWHLPHFGVYHPRNPDQIHVMFDSSAKLQGVSLNKELLPDPDPLNCLVGVSICFCQDNIAVMCDIEQMFHLFHQNFLWFLLFKTNDLSKWIIGNKMTVHLFSNGPSPAIATFGPREKAYDSEEKYGERNNRLCPQKLYVNDRLISCPTENEAITLIRNAQAMLATANLHLHKVVSNSVLIMEASRRLCQEHQRSTPTPRFTTITTLSWGPLEHQEGPFHLPCLAARKALRTERSSVCNKLSVWPSGIRIPSHPGKETNTTANRHHG